MTDFDRYVDDSIGLIRDSRIKDAMKYCIEGGKKFRPQVMFAIAKGFGKNEEIIYPAACALEYIHTYSLIHDDLPGMDNDDFRRGKLSCHRRFGEDIAILTGDAFLTHGFSVLANSSYSAELKVNLINALAKYAGMDGMIYGQLLDVTSSHDINAEDLFEIQDNNTSGLFKFACLASMYICGNDDYRFFEKLGSKLGVVFQNQDDLFDIIKSEEETGKSNSDIRNDKITALSFKSTDELKSYIDELFADLKKYLTRAPFDAKYLLEIIEKMERR